MRVCVGDSGFHPFNINAQGADGISIINTEAHAMTKAIGMELQILGFPRLSIGRHLRLAR